jgi:uncharacterized protein with GYD domain
MTMPLFCLKGQYTPEAMQGMMKSGANREEEVRKAIESVGGELKGFYGIFGDPEGFHVMIIAEMPGNAQYIATVVTAVMSGALANFRTNVLYTAEEAVEAASIVNASGVSYRPPTE